MHRGNLGILAGAAALFGCATITPAGDEASLRAVDDRQRELIAARDADGMAALAHPNLRINAPTNRVLTGTQLIGMMRSGAVAAEQFERVPETIVRTGNLGVVMGRERFTATADSESGRMFGAKSLQRRYTNIYIWEGNRWRFLARHANVVPQAAVKAR